ncbi:MAG TPA: GYD domain-containing protein [Nocardioidaceae bacterium]|jgi:uncharacterized protein with GYD domain
MPTFIYLTTWTDQGAQDPKSAVDRASAAVQALESMGVKIFEVYWTNGVYDLVMVAECADEETAYAASLDMASRGNVRPTMLRAFDRGEMTAIVSKLT